MSLRDVLYDDGARNTVVLVVVLDDVGDGSVPLNPNTWSHFSKLHL